MAWSAAEGAARLKSTRPWRALIYAVKAPRGGAEAEVFIKSLGRMLRESGNDPRSGSILGQRISLAIHLGNAALRSVFVFIM